MRFPGSDNPVYQMTLRQLRTRPPARGWRRWAAHGLYAVALAVALIAYLGEWAGLLLWRDANPLHVALQPFMLIVSLYVVFAHAGLLLRTLLMAANSISSARATGTWDLWVMTGISARHIVSGVWWAVLRAMLPGWLRLLPLRVGVITYIGAASSYQTARYVAYQLGMRNASLQLVPPGPLGLLLLVPLSLALALLSGSVIAAMGLLASALVRRVGAAYAIAAGVLLLLLGAGLLSGMLAERGLYAVFPPGDVRGTAAYSVLSNVTAAATLSWFDNGALLTTQLINYDAVSGPVDAARLWSLFRPGSNAVYPEPAFWGALGLVVGLLSAIVTVLLRLARWAVVRAGALPSST